MSENAGTYVLEVAVAKALLPRFSMRKSDLDEASPGVSLIYLKHGDVVL